MFLIASSEMYNQHLAVVVHGVVDQVIISRWYGALQGDFILVLLPVKGFLTEVFWAFWGS